MRRSGSGGGDDDDESAEDKKMLMDLLNEMELLLRNNNLENITADMLTDSVDSSLEVIKTQMNQNQETLVRIQTNAQKALAGLDTPLEEKGPK